MDISKLLKVIGLAVALIGGGLLLYTGVEVACTPQQRLYKLWHEGLRPAEPLVAVTEPISTSDRVRKLMQQAAHDEWSDTKPTPAKHRMMLAIALIVCGVVSISIGSLRKNAA